eukprot:Lankesteria_metandrocarpae@DN4627_c0_g1_i1.p1
MKFGLANKKQPPAPPTVLEKSSTQLSAFCEDDEESSTHSSTSLLLGSDVTYVPQPSTFFGRRDDHKAVTEILRNEAKQNDASGEVAHCSDSGHEDDDNADGKEDDGHRSVKTQLEKVDGGLVILNRKKDHSAHDNSDKVDEHKQKSRYIDALKLHTKRRALEQEIVYERVLKSKQDTEADATSPDEVFVTAAYQDKLEERKAFEAILKKQEAEHKADTIGQRSHISSFQRNLALRLLDARAATDEQQITQSADGGAAIQTDSNGNDSSLHVRHDAATHAACVDHISSGYINMTTGGDKNVETSPAALVPCSSTSDQKGVVVDDSFDDQRLKEEEARLKEEEAHRARIAEQESRMSARERYIMRKQLKRV